MEFKEYTEQLQDLGSRYKNESSQAWDRYTRFLSDATSGKLSYKEIQARFNDFAQKEGNEYLTKLMKSNLDYFASLTDTGFELSNKMLDTLLGQNSGQTEKGCFETEATVEPATRSELQFSGHVGTKPKQAFVVANNQDKEIAVSFEMTEFITEDGSKRTKAKTVFKPEQFELAPGAEQVVECTVPVNKEFETGQQYQALARVEGFPDMAVQLMLNVTEKAGK